MLFRALLDAMDRWASEGTEPPASRIPERGDGTLVGMDEWRAAVPRHSGHRYAARAERAAAPTTSGRGPEEGVQSTLPPEVVGP